MVKTQEPEIKWYAPQVLADRANDGFLYVVRSTGKAVHSIQSGTTKSLSVVGHALSPKTLADQVGDGVLSVVRFTGKTVRFVQSGTTGGFSKVKQTLSWGKREEKPKQQPVGLTQYEVAEVEESEFDQLAAEKMPWTENREMEEWEYPSPEQEMVVEEKEISGKLAEKVSEDKETVEEVVVKVTELPQEEVLLEEKELSHEKKTKQEWIKHMEKDWLENTVLDLDVLMEQYSPLDKSEAMQLRKTLDDLLHGSEAVRPDALKSLVSLDQVAEPFLIAFVKTGSPEMVENALDGLSQIGSQRLIDCISNVLASSNPELRIVALRTAQRLENHEAQPFLEQGLRDSDVRVKRRALSYLSWQDSSWALADIRQLCNDPEPDVKWAALKALLAVSPAEAYDNLALLIPSLDPIHKQRAALLLEQLKKVSSAPEVKEKDIASSLEDAE